MTIHSAGHAEADVLPPLKFAKPEPRPKKVRKPIQRSPLKTSVQRKFKGSATKQRTPVKRVNRARKDREFARCYHSVGRVTWIKNQPCVWCRLRGLLAKNQHAGECHNAHMMTGGMGRKADYIAIVPLCARHHQQYDEHAKPFNTISARLVVSLFMHGIQLAWLASPEYAAWSAKNAVRAAGRVSL